MILLGDVPRQFGVVLSGFGVSPVFTVYGIDVSLDCAESTAKALSEKLAEAQFRSVVIVASGPASAAAELLAIEHPRTVRKLVLVRPELSPPRSFTQRLAAWIDVLYPAGLPPSNRRLEFDARRILHRVRCPVLVVSAKDASDKAQARLSARLIPNAWTLELEQSRQLWNDPALHQALRDYFDLPVKRPQKKLAA